ncbi:hypothetical protein L3X38_042767 [Prunus dulcis]|uniref:Uncharacterized protein n=1 Tax=Prunus dulcis TaxID=3755 RepID=A0AAD4UXA6_PRUDU|nr:hypothetical protein L3X38_042767 [Prunus dulcis]
MISSTNRRSTEKENMVIKNKESSTAYENFAAYPDVAKDMRQGVYGKAPKDDLVLGQSPRTFEGIPYLHHPTSSRAENTYADELIGLGSMLDMQFRLSIAIEHLDQPSIEEEK